MYIYLLMFSHVFMYVLIVIILSYVEEIKKIYQTNKNGFRNAVADITQLPVCKYPELKGL